MALIFNMNNIISRIKNIKINDNLKNLTDKVTINILINDVNEHIRHSKYINERNNYLGNKHKLWRHDNFPSHISENICKFAIYKKYGIMPTWNTSKGDLQIIIDDSVIQIEVKGFMSDGPSSFGPTENWDLLFFVDCKNFENKEFKVYEINLSNTNDIWKNIKIKGTDFNTDNIPVIPTDEELNKYTIKELKNICKLRGIKTTVKKNDIINNLKTLDPGSKFDKVATYEEQCKEKRRPRISFQNLKKVLSEQYINLIFNGNIEELNLL